jgi:hypothetical protein
LKQPSSILCLTSDQIDPIQWNEMVQNSNNGYVYAQYEYLQAFAPQWMALVDAQYQFAWPLIYNRKWGISYLYQPYFLAQLGLIARGEAPGAAAQMAAVWRHLPKRFLYVDIDLPEDHLLVPVGLRRLERQTMQLSLQTSLPEIRSGYHRLAKRMLRKAAEAEVRISEGADLEQSIRFYRSQAGIHMRTTEVGYQGLEKALSLAASRGELLHLQAYLHGELVGVYFLLYHRRFMHSVAGVASPTGKACGAFYALTDAAIARGVGSSAVFRFEGSDEPGIAAFNAQFGAVTGSYPHWKGWRL